MLNMARNTSVFCLSLECMGDKLNSQFRASCVVIDEYHILTAAHIVADTITQHVLYKNKAYPCYLSSRIHAKYEAKNIGYNDIAVARLAKTN